MLHEERNWCECRWSISGGRDSEEIHVRIPPLCISPLEWELSHIKNVWHQPSIVRGQLSFAVFLRKGMGAQVSLQSCGPGQELGWEGVGECQVSAACLNRVNTTAVSVYHKVALTISTTITRYIVKLRCYFSFETQNTLSFLSKVVTS